MSTLGDFTATTIDGREQDLSQYEGQVVLVVNTASECGLTPQYEGLEELHQQYGDQGLVVLGFPCNQFGAQEPGSDAEVASFCQKNYGVSFPMFSKVEVNGEGQHPLFAWLKEASGDTSDIAWNFGKFLVGRDGRTVTRIGPRTEPGELTDPIDEALAA
ncbi:glutathione peroxidase [Kytococcus sedentarius]|uniref:glutathione peroxidase n=1 Tax=Kytococcus sedentarius TaxID=1276 RepID=UPI0035BC3A79